MSTVIPASAAALKLVTELEALLQQMVLEHRKMLVCIDQQQSAMKTLDARAISQVTQQQEAARLRLATLEQRRRILLQQLARMQRLAGEPKIPQLAEHFPQRKPVLMKLRDDLRQVIAEVAARNHGVARLAGAVLGHLNTAVRLLTGAVERSGVYTRQGIPRPAGRIGVIEAVG